MTLAVDRAVKPRHKQTSYLTIRYTILLYGAEIWGFISLSQLKNGLESFIKKQLGSLEVEKIHAKFCKFVLGVRTKSSNDACRDELGSLPVLYSVLLNMIKYWYYIVTTPILQNSILLEAYKDSSKMANGNKESWGGCLRKIFKELNLGAIFQNPERYTKSYIISAVKKALKGKLKDLWRFNLFKDDGKQQNQGNNLRTYRLFKLQFEFVSYLK